ncbi:GTP 3',8-cyclase MoaA [Chitinasiproducens palmae]|uniref:GTP 3',8-cyclase n=1 Tax=Chitinasiproducens palmae TaxID=1770053 RepID=A0A1H2PUT2_9BURK|nr:cyclic pyranopterin monophosphate synthase subunit MoaA [Chitinasiproducens palmae]
MTSHKRERAVIPLVDARTLLDLPPVADGLASGAQAPRDALGRRLTDLRISVTDRCNFRCVYCMPKAVFDKHYRFLPHAALLTFEEIERLARIFAGLGVDKIRLTGGEPLLRKHLDRLVEKLAALHRPDGGQLDLTLTTNGSLLARHAQRLRDAGLGRVTVSLDALDNALFARMNDVDFPVADVLRGIEAAQQAGLPVKVNMVVKRGVNDAEIVPMARYFHGSGVVLRFIEFMDVGESNGWRLDDVVSADEIVSRVDAALPLQAAERDRPSDTASRWRYLDGGGEIGVVASVTQAFCGDCSRARLSTEGRLFTCLFAGQGTDLRALLRSDAADADERLAAAVAHVWGRRTDQYSQLRSEASPRPAHARKRVEMSYIGG